MIFNSAEYIIFFIITFVIYYIANEKYRNFILLLASYIFYGYSGVSNIFILLFVTLISYFSGILIEKNDSNKIKKIIIMLSTIICISTLLYFKYSHFIIENINNLFSTSISIENIIIPLGISFFTLQAISYPIDLYRKNVKVEKNIINFALFISFFPQILSGPIGKSKQMLPQYKERHKFNRNQIETGLMIMLYGFFQKLVIADCLAIGVNNVYNNLNNYNGLPLMITVFMYSFQIYFDFASYSNIARGSAKVFGIELINNFNSPYFAESIKNFWARWHISLSTWFKEYLYIPLGGNKKGKIKTYINILIVFIVSGLWHGAAYTFIVWGLLHGLYQVIERIINYKSNCKIINIIVTFLLITFAWIFFRANNFNDAIYIIKNMFNINFNNIKEQILSIGLDKYDLLITSISIIILFFFEIMNQKRNVLKMYKTFPSLIKIGIVFILIFSIIVFGQYGPGFDNSQFIYLGY